MNQNLDCAYCMKGELVAKFGYEVCELPASVVAQCEEVAAKLRAALA